MITGNGLKAGVRFLTYDSIKEQLRDSNVGVTLEASTVSEADVPN